MPEEESGITNKTVEFVDPEVGNDGLSVVFSCSHLHSFFGPSKNNDLPVIEGDDFRLFVNTTVDVDKELEEGSRLFTRRYRNHRLVLSNGIPSQDRLDEILLIIADQAEEEAKEKQLNLVDVKSTTTKMVDEINKEIHDKYELKTVKSDEIMMFDPPVALDAYVPVWDVFIADAGGEIRHYQAVDSESGKDFLAVTKSLGAYQRYVPVEKPKIDTINLIRPKDVIQTKSIEGEKIGGWVSDTGGLLPSHNKLILSGQVIIRDGIPHLYTPDQRYVYKTKYGIADSSITPERRDDMRQLDNTSFAEVVDKSGEVAVLSDYADAELVITYSDSKLRGVDHRKYTIYTVNEYELAQIESKNNKDPILVEQEKNGYFIGRKVGSTWREPDDEVAVFAFPAYEEDGKVVISTDTDRPGTIWRLFERKYDENHTGYMYKPLKGPNSNSTGNSLAQLRGNYRRGSGGEDTNMSIESYEQTKVEQTLQ
jgi:hypothetical protein